MSDYTGDTISSIPLSPTDTPMLPTSTNHTSTQSVPEWIAPHEIISEDITRHFRDAASDLKTGQLVKDEFFTLQEAVGAVEIMDPKMDSGCLEEGETLEAGYDVQSELLPAEIVGIMDQMVCLEMAWNMGNPLSQTIFTSHYIDRLLWPEPKDLEQAHFIRNEDQRQGNSMVNIVLRSFCLALVKTCDLVLRRISNEHYYEEEDFVTNLYNRNLLSFAPWEIVVELLDEAISWIEEDLTLRGLDPSPYAAICARLLLRRNILIAVGLDLSNNTTEQRLRWQTVSKDVASISSTHNQGKSVEQAFSGKIQRQLASTTPPRPVINLPFSEAREYLTRLCKHGEEVYGILDSVQPAVALTFAMAFQSRSPPTCTYVRCLLQALVFHDMRVLGRISIRKFLFDDFEEVAMPGSILVDSANELAEAPQGPRFKIFRLMDSFVMRVADAFLDIFRAVSMNRCRMRRMLCHLIMDWDTLQLEAENLDLQLQDLSGEVPKVTDSSLEKTWSFPISSWAYFHKLRQMEWIVQLGFELNLYQNDEIGGMYWYLQHLTGTRIQHLNRIYSFSISQKRDRSQFNSEQEASIVRSESFLELTILEAAATHALAKALTHLYSFLAHISLLPQPYATFPYGQPQLRYALRTKPFMSLSIPDLPSYTNFMASYTAMGLVADRKGSSSLRKTTLDTATDLIRTARKELEALSKLDAESARCQGSENWWRASVKNMLRACIMAGITVATIKKGIDQAGTRDLKDVLDVRLETSKESYHPWWIVPKISLR